MQKHLPLSRTQSEAFKQGHSHFFTGKPCKRGHYSRRYAESGHCLQCQAERVKNWRREKGVV